MAAELQDGYAAEVSLDCGTGTVTGGTAAVAEDPDLGPCVVEAEFKDGVMLVGVIEQPQPGQATVCSRGDWDETLNCDV